MPSVPCPNCTAVTSRWLFEMSAAAKMNWYRCEDCGHVWTTNKKTNEVSGHVTPLTRQMRPDKT